MPISRRRFLEAAGGAWTSGILYPTPAQLPQTAGRTTRVLVMGAGMAGLAAAYELERAGFDVLVLEAKTIPGGRVHTLREPFADGLWAEAGAMFFEEAHNLTMGYIREFGLPLLPINPRGFVPSLFHVAGRRVETLPGQPVAWPIGLDPSEEGRSIFELQDRYWYSPAAAIGLDPDAWPHPGLSAYDRMSLADFWREQGASDGAVRLLVLGYLGEAGEGPESLSALGILHDTAILGSGSNTYRIDGGNDRLPGAFAARLEGKIRYGAPVAAIRQSADGVELTVEDRSGRHAVSGDYLIATAPFPVLRKVAFDPPLPELYRRAIARIDSTSLTRIYLQCRERFWEPHLEAWTDLPVMSVRDSTMGQPGIRGILESMTTGANARRFAAMNEEDRIEQASIEIGKVHPGLDEYMEGGASVAWDSDPWALGDYAYYQPGQIQEFFPTLQEPAGRIYFAGDHIGGQPGWVQSALASAQAAARAISVRG